MIRPATETDLPALVHLNSLVQELHARHAPAFFKTPSEEPGRAEWFRNLLTRSEVCILVVEERQAIVGYLFAQEVQKEENWMRPLVRLLMLEHIAVDPAHRNQGIGHALMERFFAEAGGRGISRTELVYWSFNEPAARFFKKHGFIALNVRLGLVLPRSTTT